MKHIILLFFFFFFVSFTVVKRTMVTFQVIDACRTQVIPFATIVLSNKDTTIEVACKNDGLCKLAVNEGTYKLQVFSIGYVAFEKKVQIKGVESSMVIQLKILCQ